MRSVLAVGMALVLLAVAAPAEARPALLKREARHEALQFVAPFVDLLDVDRTIPTWMVQPRKCRRDDRRTVTCRFTAYLPAERRAVRGSVRIHLQRDGLLGFLIRGLPSLW
jgi:hypothetical protein